MKKSLLKLLLFISLTIIISSSVLFTCLAEDDVRLIKPAFVPNKTFDLTQGIDQSAQTLFSQSAVNSSSVLKDVVTWDLENNDSFYLSQNTSISMGYISIISKDGYAVKREDKKVDFIGLNKNSFTFSSTKEILKIQIDFTDEADITQFNDSVVAGNSVIWYGKADSVMFGCDIKGVTKITFTLKKASEDHNITIDENIKNGTVFATSPGGKVDKEEKDQRISIVVLPDEGYRDKRISVYKTDDPTVTVKVSDSTFIMPDFDVTISVEFVSIWTEWKEFAPKGVNTATYNFTVLDSKTSGKLKLYVREQINNPDYKQIKVVEWGKELSGVSGCDLIFDWKSVSNSCTINPNNTGFYAAAYAEYINIMDVATWQNEIAYTKYYPCTFDPETGVFTFNVAYTLKSLIGTTYSFGYGVETLAIDGYVDYTISNFALTDLVEENGKAKQYFYVESQDSKNIKYGVISSNYTKTTNDILKLLENQGANFSPIDGEYYVEVTAEGYYYLFVATYDNEGNLADCKYSTFFYTPSDEWETIGEAEYTDDIIASLYKIDVTTYNVEVQKNKLTEGIYRLKNVYGDNFPYSQYGDVIGDTYIYINAINPNKVRIDIVFDYQSIGISFDDEAELFIGQLAYGTFADNVFTFPTKGLLVGMGSKMWYANIHGALKICLPYMAENITEDTNGSLDLSKNYGFKGDEIVLDVKPNKGFVVDKVYVVMDGETSEITPVDGKYAFNMTNSDVQVFATFKEAQKTEAEKIGEDVNSVIGGLADIYRAFDKTANTIMSIFSRRFNLFW